MGRTLWCASCESGIAPNVIELNHETVQQLKTKGIAALYGDAAQPQLLELAGAAHSGSLIFAAGGSPPDEVIRAARGQGTQSENSGVGALLLRQRGRSFRRVGAEVIVAAEAEVGRAMSKRLLIELGATADMLDRARAELASV